jgi:anti-anti-sigma regulatory factor
MLLAYEYAPDRVIGAEPDLTVHNMQRFQARVELAAAATDHLVVDLTHTKFVDGWALLLLRDLVERYGPRITLAAPNHLRTVFERVL